MSDTGTNDQPAVMRFKRSVSRTRMPADQARRQGEIVALAFTHLGGKDAALDFLNTHSEALDARPLDVASQSDEGFERVAGLIVEPG